MKNERDLRYYKKLNYKMDVFFDAGMQDCLS